MGKYDSSEAPWDPLWDYVLGEEEQKTWYGGRKEPEPDFLDYMFPEEEKPKRSWSLQRENSKKKQQEQDSYLWPTSSQEPERRGFFRRKKKDSNTWDSEALSKSFDEMLVDEEYEKEKRRNRLLGRRNSQSPARRRSSSRFRKSKETKQTTDPNAGSELLEGLAMDFWGEENSEGEEDDEEDEDYSTEYDSQDEASASHTSVLTNQTEEYTYYTATDQSFNTFMDDDDSTIASASSLLTDNEPQQRKMNEVRLRFTPGKGDLLPKIEENEDFEDDTAESSGEDEMRDELYDGRSVSGSIENRSSTEERMGPVVAAPTLPQRGLGPKIICCGPSHFSEEANFLSSQTGIPVQELRQEDLELIFPKLRLVSDKSSRVLGNSASFDESLPAYLQVPSKALARENEPSSVLEYEYERGTHMRVVFKRFGYSPRSLLSVEAYEEPPPAFEQGLISYNPVLVQVEASTVSQTDCVIRRGEWWGPEHIPLPNTPGVDFVGKLYRIDKESAKRNKLKKGDRVISLTKWGGNSRYLSVDPSRLVKVPESVDPAEAVCLAETYLSVFQMLHHGQSPGARYRKKSLNGRTVLFVGTMTPTMARAVAQLSAAAGVLSVYATCKRKHYQQMRSIGIVPLSEDPVDWFEKLVGKIDIVISLGEEVTPLHFKLLHKDGGEIVVASHGEVDLAPDTDSRLRPSRFVCARSRAHKASRTHLYDVYSEWDMNMQKCKQDMTHLIGLLENRQISPNVLDRIPLSKVARAQELIESKRLSGFLVCEPWMVTKARAVLL